jgi:hypothetical protein
MSPVLMDFAIALGFTGIAALMLPLAYAHFERSPTNRDVSIQLSLIAFTITVILAYALLFFVTAALSAGSLALGMVFAALGPVAAIVLLVGVWKAIVPYLIRDRAKTAKLAQGPLGPLPV